MSSYFIRFTANAEADLVRGYSFVGYNLESSRESIFQNIAEQIGAIYNDDFDLNAFMDDNEQLVAQDNVTSMWGVRRSGLCGFGSYGSVEEAISDIPELSRQYWGIPALVVFQGVRTFDQDMDGQDDGLTFRPISIAHRFMWNGANYE